MSMRNSIIAALLLLPAMLWAQFTDVLWGTAQGDTILPVCTHVQQLPADYEGYRYTAHIEYPEFCPMTAADVARYRLAGREEQFCAWPVIDTRVTIAAKEPQLDVSFVPVVYVDGRFMRINSYKLVVERAAASRPAKAATRSAAERYAANSVLAEGRWVKIRVSTSGVHQITAADLSKMGFKNPAKVRLYGYGGNQLPETNLHTLIDDLCEIPLWREGNRLLFYANGPVSWSYSAGRYVHRQNVYSNYGCYFLTEGDEEPMAFPVADEAVSFTSTYTSFPYYTLYENDALSMCNYGRVLLDSYNFAQGRVKSYTFDTKGITGDNMVLDIAFGSSAEAASSVTMEVAGTRVGSLSVPQKSSTDLGRISSGRYNVTALNEKTVVRLTHNVSNAALTGYLDYLRLNYQRNLQLQQPQMNFRGASSSAANAKYVIGGADNTVRVWRVTSQDDICEIKGTLQGSEYSVIAPAIFSEEYVVLRTGETFPSVQIAGVVANQNLHALQQTDMVIIVPSNGAYLQPAERLAQAHRTMDGISVAVVTAEQVYNEFSSGTPDATAYRRLMKMLYDRASSAVDAPKYLLLFGDGMVDNRAVTTKGHNPDDYLLCYESENSVSAIYSYVLEDYYGYLDDDEGASHTRDKVDIGVGRFPVKSLMEANAVVDKTIAYMNNGEAGAWQNVIALLGDDGDKDIPNQHMKDAEGVARVVGENYPAYILDRIYWDNYEPVANSTGNSYPLVTEAIRNRLDEGALVVNYSGHGSANLLSHEMVWFASDMQALTSPRLPFWVTASCDIGPFDMGDGSLSEAAILNPNGGAVGLFTTTRTVLQVYNAIINRAFMEVLLSPVHNGLPQAVGDAVRRAKNNVITAGASDATDFSENKLQFVLLGDPALRLKLPQYSFVIEKFNGVDAATATNVSAGSKLTVEGYVAQPDGSPATDFTGLLTSQLYDSAEEVTTRDNTGLGAYSYTAYEKNLFVGSDSVKNGRFNITMPVPMDMSYSGEQGLLSLFAVDNTKSAIAQGSFDNFLIAGTAPSLENDGKGPEIKLFISGEATTDGVEVNATPYIYAELFDENGINTVGTGVGHDIMLIVDNDIEHTYNLNDVYNPVVGDYTRGTVGITLGSLSAGEHTAVLRAWDLYNNSSVAEFSFVVVPGLAPHIASLELNPSPARFGQLSTFVLAHNFPGSTLDVTIEVFNMLGQTVWKNSETAHCAGNVYTYDWDVTASSGAAMPTGVYLCRASISSGGGSVVTKSGKFIVINNK
ncbi:MAG: type IX secretion system sortase PorU [Bacteroidaceae bacterium]|nr:type IX secretion system sortase PorU [Bacteroidaceae bacterium]